VKDTIQSLKLILDTFIKTKPQVWRKDKASLAKPMTKIEVMVLSLKIHM